MNNRNTKTQKRLVLIFVIVLLISVSLPVFAHSGGTDKKDGHYVDGTNEYHYHHGWPAHDHDGGECPYDFVDNVDHDRDESSESSSSTARDIHGCFSSKLSRLTWWQILLAIVLNAIWIVPFFICVILPYLTKENLLNVTRFILILMVACSPMVFLFSLALWVINGWSRSLFLTIVISSVIMAFTVWIINRRRKH